jgi:hypothetical protein
MTNSAPPGTPAATARLAGQAQRAARTAVAHTIVRSAPEASSAEAVRIARELELAVHTESAPASAAPARPGSRGPRWVPCWP